MGTTRFIRRVESLRGQLEMEPLGPQFPRHYAQVRNQLEAAGHKIGDRDTLIASHALLLGATLVTRNRREFSRIAGLQVENWETD